MRPSKVRPKITQTPVADCLVGLRQVRHSLEDVSVPFEVHTEFESRKSAVRFSTSRVSRMPSELRRPSVPSARREPKWEVEVASDVYSYSLCVVPLDELWQIL